jgi:hypothetical protein
LLLAKQTISPETFLAGTFSGSGANRREKRMHHFKLIFTVVVVALVVIWATNNVTFLGKLTGQQ